MIISIVPYNKYIDNAVQLASRDLKNVGAHTHERSIITFFISPKP